MPSESRLLTLQRRFLDALTEPIHGDSRSLSKLPPRPGEVSPDFEQTANEFILPTMKMEPVERLELYHRQYWYRLLDSIEEDFPGLKLLLGEEAFWSLMEAYLEAAPPTSYTLRHLGAGLAGFITAHPDRVDRPVHAEDLARLEYALMEAHEAGQSPPLDPTQLAGGPVFLQPHLRLLALRTQADDTWERAENQRPLGRVSRAAMAPDRFLIVFRDLDFDLRVVSVSRVAFEILRSLDETHSLAETMEWLSTRPDLLPSEEFDQVSAWFGEWISRGWLTGVARSSPAAKGERRSP